MAVLGAQDKASMPGQTTLRLLQAFPGPLLHINQRPDLAAVSRVLSEAARDGQ